MAHLEYLRDRCKDEGLSIKVFNRQLIIYSESEYEGRGSVYTLTYGMSQILAYGFTSRLNETYASAENAYVSPETGKLIEGKFEPPYGPEGSGSILKINQRVDPEEGEGGENGGEGEGGERRRLPGQRAFELGTIDYSNDNAAASEAASRVAKSKLREKNKREKEGIIAVVGNPGYLSGLCMDINRIRDSLRWQVVHCLHNPYDFGGWLRHGAPRAENPRGLLNNGCRH